MQREQALNILRAHLPELKRNFGVKRIGIFGSTARGEALPHSDIDILIEFYRGYSLMDLARVKVFLEQLFHREVDIATSKTISRYLDTITKEVIFV
jgi:predicted nucleotidyltransferase